MKLVKIGEYYVNPERVTFLDRTTDYTVTRIWFGPDDHIKVLYRPDEVARKLTDEIEIHEVAAGHKQPRSLGE